MGVFFGVAKIPSICLGCLKFMIFFGGVNGRCWAKAYVCRKNEIPPPPWGIQRIRGIEEREKKI